MGQLSHESKCSELSGQVDELQYRIQCYEEEKICLRTNFKSYKSNILGKVQLLMDNEILLTRKFENLANELSIENANGNKNYDKIETFYDENDNEGFNHMNYESFKVKVNSRKACQDIELNIRGMRICLATMK